MPKKPQPVVIVHFDHKGEITYLKPQGVRLLIVDDRSPHDHVYEWTTEHERAAFEPFFRGDVGTAHDARGRAMRHRINAAMEGRSHLEPVR
jgi:hypothetical protein